MTRPPTRRSTPRIALIGALVASLTAPPGLAQSPTGAPGGRPLNLANLDGAIAAELEQALNELHQSRFGLRHPETGEILDDDAVKYLILKRNIYVSQLKQFEARLEVERAASRKEKLETTDGLYQPTQFGSDVESPAGDVQGAYHNMVAAHRDAANAGDQKRYEALLRRAKDAAGRGDTAAATELAGQAGATSWGWYQRQRKEFFELLDHNPMLGLRLQEALELPFENGTIAAGTPLFEAFRELQDDINTRGNSLTDTREPLTQEQKDQAFVELFNGYLDSGIAQVGEEIESANDADTVKELVEFSEGRYLRQHEVIETYARLFGSETAQKLLDAAANAGFQPDDGLEQALIEIGLGIIAGAGLLIPVVGWWITAGAVAVTIYRDGDQLIIALDAAESAEAGQAAVGHEQAATAEEQANAAKVQVAVTVVSGAFDLGVVDGVRILNRSKKVLDAADEAVGTGSVLERASSSVAGGADDLVESGARSRRQGTIAEDGWVDSDTIIDGGRHKGDRLAAKQEALAELANQQRTPADIRTDASNWAQAEGLSLEQVQTVSNRVRKDPENRLPSGALNEEAATTALIDELTVEVANHRDLTIVARRNTNDRAEIMDLIGGADLKNPILDLDLEMWQQINAKAALGAAEGWTQEMIDAVESFVMKHADADLLKLYEWNPAEFGVGNWVKGDSRVGFVPVFREEDLENIFELWSTNRPKPMGRPREVRPPRASDAAGAAASDGPTAVRGSASSANQLQKALDGATDRSTDRQSDTTGNRDPASGGSSGAEGTAIGVGQQAGGSIPPIRFELKPRHDEENEEHWTEPEEGDTGTHDGDDSTGGDSTGGDSTGGDSTGGDSTGGDSTGGDSTGGDSTGGDSTGGDSAGGDSTGGYSPGDDATGHAQDPIGYNPPGSDGPADSVVQRMVIEIAPVEGESVKVPRGARLTVPVGRLRFASLPALAGSGGMARVTSGSRRERGCRRSGAAKDEESQVQIFLTSLGGSTGEAFTATIINGGPEAVTIAAGAIVVEPLEKKAGKKLAKELAKLREKYAPITLKLDAYCLEFARLPPSRDQAFRIASEELQERFAPVRDILDASRKLYTAGGLNPDVGPLEYFHSIRQWAIWTDEEGFDAGSFADAFVEHTRKNMVSEGQPWASQYEAILRGALPNRWNDVQRILEAARTP